MSGKNGKERNEEMQLKEEHREEGGREEPSGKEDQVRTTYRARLKGGSQVA